MISAILLAAGRGSRIGQCKALLPWRGESLVCRGVGELMKSMASEVVIVTGAERERVEKELVRLDAPKAISIVWNQAFETGIMSSIQTGIRAADPSSAGYLISLVDLPFLTAADHDVLIKAHGLVGSPLVRYRHEGVPCHPVIIGREFRDEILGRPAGDLGAMFLFKKYPFHVTWLEMNGEQGSLDIDEGRDLHAHMSI